MAQKNRPGRLRIVAGNWRSRVLPIADVEGLRPTSERIRETLFNWLGPSIYGTQCLDLFSGTGALGLEALSRGAAAADFVERAPAAVRHLTAAIKTLDAQGAAVYQQDAKAFLRTDHGPYDVIFLDPPFKDHSQELLCRLIHEQQKLTSGGRIYLEQARDQQDIALPPGWEFLKSKVAGQVRYSLVVNKGVT